MSHQRVRPSLVSRLLFGCLVSAATVLGLGGAPTLAMAQPGAAPSPTARHVIAILPFDNVSGAAVDDWLGRGIAESVTADFVAQGDVTVVDRTRVLAAFRASGPQGGSGRRHAGRGR